MKLNCGAERHHYSMFDVQCSMLDVHFLAAESELPLSKRSSLRARLRPIGAYPPACMPYGQEAELEANLTPPKANSEALFRPFFDP